LQALSRKYKMPFKAGRFLQERLILWGVGRKRRAYFAGGQSKEALQGKEKTGVAFATPVLYAFKR
jgi:hypothetical protein